MFPFAKKKPILDDAAQQRIVAAIKEAESNTTGEVRVFIEHECSYMDALDRAKEVFASLDMQKTVKRNAIIVYLATEDRQFALFGDVEIYERAGGAAFWQEAAALLKKHLRNKQVTEGICTCIHALGQALSTHFPYDASVPKNELPDEIVFGK